MACIIIQMLLLHKLIQCILFYITARIVTMEDYSQSNDELSVTVTINELCLNYLVLVIFGTRPSVNDDCVDQEESVPKNISSGDSETFAVSVTLEDGYMYCYTIIVNGARGEYMINKLC